MGVFVDLGWGMLGGERREELVIVGGGVVYGYVCFRVYRLCSFGVLFLVRLVVDNVVFRWCVCGSFYSWCWVCIFSVLMRAKLFKDLFWGLSKFRGMSVVT